MSAREPIDEEEDDDDQDFDPEGPDPSEMDSSDDPDLEVCPHCRKLISEEAERCPHCGEYVTPGERASWSYAYVVVAVLVGLTILMLIYMAGIH